MTFDNCSNVPPERPTGPGSDLNYVQLHVENRQGQAAPEKGIPSSTGVPSCFPNGDFLLAGLGTGSGTSNLQWLQKPDGGWPTTPAGSKDPLDDGSKHPFGEPLPLIGPDDGSGPLLRPKKDPLDDGSKHPFGEPLPLIGPKEGGGEIPGPHEKTWGPGFGNDLDKKIHYDANNKPDRITDSNGWYIERTFVHGKEKWIGHNPNGTTFETRITGVTVKDNEIDYRYNDKTSSRLLSNGTDIRYDAYGHLSAILLPGFHDGTGPWITMENGKPEYNVTKDGELISTPITNVNIAADGTISFTQDGKKVVLDPTPPGFFATMWGKAKSLVP